jgi:hypothetical protein
MRDLIYPTLLASLEASQLSLSGGHSHQKLFCALNYTHVNSFAVAPLPASVRSPISVASRVQPLT